MKYRCLVFDWDGTLIDSADSIVASLQGAANDLDLVVPPDEAIRNIIGLELTCAIQTLFPEYDSQMIARIRQHYADHFVRNDQLHPAQLFAGVQEGLANLHRAGYRLAIATGKSRKGLARVLPQSGVAAFFHATRCADETASKPAPDMLYELMRELEMSPHEVVMVGDTEFDMEMAQRANVDRIAVTYGAHHPERLLKYDPQLCVERFEQLLDWLE